MPAPDQSPAPAPRLPRRRRRRHEASRSPRSRALPALLLAASAASFVVLHDGPAAPQALPAAAALALPQPALALDLTGSAPERASRGGDRAPLAAPGEVVAPSPPQAVAPVPVEVAPVPGEVASVPVAPVEVASVPVGPVEVVPAPVAAAAPAAPSYVRPVTDGPLTSPFGRRWGRLHAGIDFGVPVGTPVLAAAAGVVVSTGYDAGGYGNNVHVQLPDGTVTVYGHLSAIQVTGGDVVAGQALGLSGNTGHSTGPHLHFEVRTTGGPVDARAWLTERGVAV